MTKLSAKPEFGILSCLVIIIRELLLVCEVPSTLRTRFMFPVRWPIAPLSNNKHTFICMRANGAMSRPAIRKLFACRQSTYQISKRQSSIIEKHDKQRLPVLFHRFTGAFLSPIHPWPPPASAPVGCLPPPAQPASGGVLRIQKTICL